MVVVLLFLLSWLGYGCCVDVVVVLGCKGAWCCCRKEEGLPSWGGVEVLVWCC